MYDKQKRDDIIGSLVRVTYLDHCSDDSEMTIEEISKKPVLPPKCTCVGYMTYESPEFVMISSERSDHGEDAGNIVTYTSHTTILRNTILETKQLQDSKLKG